MENQDPVLAPPTSGIELVYERDARPQPHYGVATCVLNRVYVSGFSKKVTAKQLKCIFRPHGKVVHTNVIPHLKYGFVTFQSEEDVLRLLNRVHEGKLTIYVEQYEVNIQRAYYAPKRVAQPVPNTFYSPAPYPYDNQRDQAVNVYNHPYLPVWYQFHPQIPEQTVSNICQSQQQMVMPVQPGLPISPYGFHQTSTEPFYFC